MKVYEFNDKDFEILEDVLSEIEESRVYEEEEDKKSLEKLQKCVNDIRHIRNFNSAYPGKVNFIIIAEVKKNVSNTRPNY